ncbi:IniB N-terminal domain-containing protein [Saccharomonospora xinjiangensis]|uniref:IniB N-terminal domain-containing protein n=1 Tax=Saccharomonospora xinjiangensis TaxID=75294 RepID=UPI00350EC329
MIHAQGETETEQEVTVSEPSAAAPQEQTLHDFVLTLLNDATARAAFAHDPARALETAGLGDITAEDVQDVIPLVMDYSGLPAADALGTVGAAGGAVSGLEGAIEQLRGVADAAGDRADLAGTAGLDSGVGSIATGGAAALDGVSGVLRYDTEAAAGEAAGRLGEDGLNVGSYSEGLLGKVAAVGGAGPDGAGGMANVDSAAGGVGGMVDGSLDGVSGTGSVDTSPLDAGLFGDLSGDGAAGGAGLRTDAVSAEATGMLSEDGYAAGGSLETPFGTYGIEVANEAGLSLPEIDTTGDLADTLDTDTITRGSEAAASTVATYVASGGAALHGAVRSTAGDLPVDLPTELPAAAPAGVPSELPVNVPGAVADAPSVDDAVLTQPRNLTEDVEEPVEVAGIGTDLPNVAGSIRDLASEVQNGLGSVPGQLGAAVPTGATEVPDLPVLNPMPESGDYAADSAHQVHEGAERVTDTVSDSPLGGVAEKGQDLLSDAPVVGDLDLGH